MIIRAEGINAGQSEKAEVVQKMFFESPDEIFYILINL